MGNDAILHVFFVWSLHHILMSTLGGSIGIKEISMDSIELLNELEGWYNKPCKVVLKDGDTYYGILSATHHDGFGHIVVSLSNKGEVKEFSHTEIEEVII